MGLGGSGGGDDEIVDRGFKDVAFDQEVMLIEGEVVVEEATEVKVAARQGDRSSQQCRVTSRGTGSSVKAGSASEGRYFSISIQSVSEY